MVRQERAERTLRRIVSAAADRFERNGYSGTSLDDITRAAGVSKGAFYFHFASKKQVADAVVTHSYGLLEDLIDGLPAQDTPAVQQLIDLAHGLARLLHSEPTVRTALRFHRERGETEEDFDHFSLWYQAVEQLLGDATKRGELREDVPDEAGWTLAVVILLSVEWMATRRLSEEETTRRVTDLWEVLLAALASAQLTGIYRTAAPLSC